MELCSYPRISRALWTKLLSRAPRSRDASAPRAQLLSPEQSRAAPALDATLLAPRRRHWAPSLRGQHGGAAVEYVLVTTFATLLSIGALAYVGSLVKERLTILAQRLGSEAPLPDFDIMGDASP